jgi:hypothetical protein
MSVLTASYYKSDPLHDAYFAIWLLSNAFYNARVFESLCGNYASNGGFDINNYERFSQDTCPSIGIKKDPNLTGKVHYCLNSY